MQQPNHDLINMIQRAEIKAKNQPKRYKLQLLLFALLGYVVIFSILLILIGITGGLFGLAIFSTPILVLLIKKKLILLLLPTIWILARSLWIKFETPEGYQLTKNKCPELFNELDQLRKKLQTPNIHKVILTPEFNAAITQTPRLGVFGWQHNTLTLGLELMLTLNPDQFRAVLAHELGHLSGNHSRFAGWIYRVRISWERIMMAFAQSDSIGGRLMASFFNWYSPKFGAYSFVLARSNEYEADSIAADLTSPSNMALALVNSQVTSPYIDKYYWQDFFRGADHSSQPEQLPWAGLLQFLRNHKIDDDDALNTALAHRLQEKTSYIDTHPCLADRINAMAIDMPAPNAASHNCAAEIWLGSSFDTVIQDFDKHWVDAWQDKWKSRYEYVQKCQVSLAKFDCSSPNTLSDEDLWKYAQLKNEFGDQNESLPIFKLYETRYPQDPDTGFRIGQILASQDNDDCLNYLKTALQRYQLIEPAVEIAWNYLNARNRTEEAQWWEKQYHIKKKQDKASHAERSNIQIGDEIISLTLKEDDVEKITAVCRAHKRVKRAWIAQKWVRHFADTPTIVIVVKLREFCMFASENQILQEIIDSIETNSTNMIITYSGDSRKLAKSLIKQGTELKLR